PPAASPTSRVTSTRGGRARGPMPTRRCRCGGRATSTSAAAPVTGGAARAGGGTATPRSGWRGPRAGLAGTGTSAAPAPAEAEAVDSAGGESGAQAFVQDPQHLVQASGLKSLGKPKFKEPRPRTPAPVRCSGRTGTIAFRAPEYAADSTALVTVGATRGPAS